MINRMAEYNAQVEDFEEITEFLAEFRGLFDFKLTRIFLDGILENLSLEWKETLINISNSELADLPFGKVKTEWPGSLKNFVQNCVKFSLSREITESSKIFHLTSPVELSEINPEIRRGMTGKKEHEVCHMTSLIDHVTQTKGNDGVIDVGSGLGYLGQVLHCNYGHSVLGLEGKQGHTSGADKRTQKFESCHHLHNVTCELSQQTQSQQEFLSLILDWHSKIISDGPRCCHLQTGSRTFNKSFQTGCDKKTNDCEVNEKSENSLNKQSDEILTGTVSNSTDVLTLPVSIRNEKSNSDLKDAVKTCTNFDAFDFKSSDNNMSNSSQRRDNSIDCDSEQTKDIVSDKNDQLPTFCMVGLHCCGDLTPIMLQNFVDLDEITSLCCVSCCYHRMKFNELTQKHDNFPLSQKLKRSLTKTWNKYSDFKFSSYCLRLAAQETRVRWQEQTQEDHDFHMKNVAYRGVLETCLHEDTDDKTFRLEKNVRKLAHRGDYQSFDRYIQAVFKHVHVPETESLEEFRTKFYEKMQQNFDKHQHHLSLIEPLTALQYLLQPVIETLIHRDRKQWLYEQNIHAEIIPVFDEFISPRNLALVAWK